MWGKTLVFSNSEPQETDQIQRLMLLLCVTVCLRERERESERQREIDLNGLDKSEFARLKGTSQDSEVKSLSDLRDTPEAVCFIAKRGKGRAAEGDKGKKVKTTSDASGGKSASQKSQPSGGKVREKSQATRTGKTPFEVSTSQKTSYYVDVEKTRRLGYLVLSSSLGSATIKTLKMILERLQDQNCSGTSASD